MTSIKAGLLASLVSVVILGGIKCAYGQEVESGGGLVCNTAQEVEDFAALFDGNAVKTLSAVASQGSSCMLGVPVKLIRIKKVKDAKDIQGFIEIWEVQIVALNAGQGWVEIPPTTEFVPFRVEGRDA